MISLGGTAIFDKYGYGDILDWQGDNRSENENYKKVTFTTFLRIPYEYMVDYDMEPDAYYGVPTIYVIYAKNDMPCEEILYGVPGHYEKDSLGKSKLTYYFEDSKRKKLE